MSMFDSNSHIKNLSKSLLDAVRQVHEAKKQALDPVGKEDADIDNDGKSNTTSDKYLLNRRAVRSAVIKEAVHPDTQAGWDQHFKDQEAVEAKKKSNKDYDGDGKVESPHAEHNGVRRNAIKAAIAKKMMKESEQIDEISKATALGVIKSSLNPSSPRSVSNLASKGGFKLGQADADDYTAGEEDDAKAVKRSNSAILAAKKLAGTARVNATNEEHMGFKKLEKKIEGQGKSPDAAAAIAASIGRKKFGKEKFQQMAAAGKKHMEEEAMDGVAAGSLANDGHMCATKIFKEGFGEGTPLYSQHANPDADGNIAWYDCVFEDSIERVVIGEEGVEVIESEWHSKHPYSKSSKKMGIKPKKHMEEEVEQIDEMKNVPTHKLKAIVDRGERDEEGMSPAFGMQVKAARNELIRRKKAGIKEEVEDLDEASGSARTAINNAEASRQRAIKKAASAYKRHGDMDKAISDHDLFAKDAAKIKAMCEEVETLDEAMQAKDRFDHHHSNAVSLIKSIGEHLAREKKEAAGHADHYSGKKGPSWGHVGSMENIAQQLGHIHDQLARKGEYAETNKLAEDTSASTKAREKVELVARPGQRMADAYQAVRARQASVQDKVIDEAKTGRSPDTGDEAKYHIMNQLGKAAQSMKGEHEIWFKNGEKKNITQGVARRLLTHYRDLPRPADKEELQKKLHASHESMHDVVKGI